MRGRERPLQEVDLCGGGRVGRRVRGAREGQDELRVLVRCQQHPRVGRGGDGAAEGGGGGGVPQTPDGGDFGGGEGQCFGDVKEGGESLDAGWGFAGARRWGLRLGFIGRYPRCRWRRRERRRGCRSRGGVLDMLDLGRKDLFQLGDVFDSDPRRHVSTVVYRSSDSPMVVITPTAYSLAFRSSLCRYRSRMRSGSPCVARKRTSCTCAQRRCGLPRRHGVLAEMMWRMVGAWRAAMGMPGRSMR